MTRFIILCTKFIVALIVALLFTSCRYSLNISGIDAVSYTHLDVYKRQIYAAVKASNGESYQYPLTINFLK